MYDHNFTKEKNSIKHTDFPILARGHKQLLYYTMPT